MLRASTGPISGELRVQGKIAAFDAHPEGGHAIENFLPTLRQFYRTRPCALHDADLEQQQ